MKYLFDSADLPPTHKKWIRIQKDNVDKLIKSGKKYDLLLLEEEYLKSWNIWQHQIDKLYRIRQVNIREEILKARFELTKYNEALMYLIMNNTYKKVKRGLI